jgi:hypothetical protein
MVANITNNSVHASCLVYTQQLRPLLCVAYKLLQLSRYDAASDTVSLLSFVCSCMHAHAAAITATAAKMDTWWTADGADWHKASHF